MAYQHLEPFSKQVTIVVGLTVVGFMAFGLALSFYRNALFDQTLANIDVKNDLLREKILEGRRKLEYYQSAQYKDKYAKEHLGRISPGENVLIITQETERPYLIEAEDTIALNEQQEAAYLEILRQMPIIDHWKMFLFHREEAEEIKRSFLGG